MDNPILKVDLPTGIVLIECFPDLAPNHVKQILDQANRGLYDGIIFHRVIPGFMAQGGWTKLSLPQLQAEFNSYPHVEGTCSMARTNDPNSASDQFFICFGDCQFLDRNYTAWGKVIFGMSHIFQINAGEPPDDPTPIIKMRQIDINKIN